MRETRRSTDQPDLHEPRLVDSLPSPLVARLMAEIKKRIASGRLAEGQHLTVQTFLAEFDVSKSPVIRALENLANAGVLRREANKGFFVATANVSPLPMDEGASPPSDETIYMRLADERLGGQLPDRVTEAELMRRYGLTRPALSKVLDRASSEGWMARRAGQGWDFLPMLDSEEALIRSYRFRLAIEPAALLEPTFRADGDAFRAYRDRIGRIALGGLAQMSRAEIFDLGSSFHEMLMKCSGNDFFFAALQRINRLRRLVEYRHTMDAPRHMRESREHWSCLTCSRRGIARKLLTSCVNTC